MFTPHAHFVVFFACFYFLFSFHFTYPFIFPLSSFFFQIIRLKNHVSGSIFTVSPKLHRLIFPPGGISEGQIKAGKYWNFHHKWGKLTIMTKKHPKNIHHWLGQK
jgi:hypothetical protein